MKDFSSHRRRGYALSALFILMATCGILLAMLAPVGRALANRSLGPVDVVVAGLLGGLLLAVLGALIGVQQLQWRIGLLAGILTGAASGAILGPALLAWDGKDWTITAAAVAGSFLLLLVGLIIRLSSRPPARADNARSAKALSPPQG